MIWISTIIDFSVGKLLHKAINNDIRKKLLFISILSNLLILCAFKYYNFFINSLNIIIGQSNYFNSLNIILPVGISFYTFQSMAYTIDIYNHKIKPAKTLIDFANFIAFFFLNWLLVQLKKLKIYYLKLKILKDPVLKIFQKIIILIFFGYLKKVLLADNIGAIVDDKFFKHEVLNSFDILIVLFLFASDIF